MRRVVRLCLGVCAAFAAGAAGAQAPTEPPAGQATPQSASLTLGGEVILTLRSAAGEMTPQQRVDAIDGRVSDLLGTPDIKVSDVAVYTPTGKAPVIYALGRRLITVDAATAKAEGEGKTPLELAQMWARKLQQMLPRVNWRPSNEAEPKVPAHPLLVVTPDLAHVGGNVGLVTLRNKVVFKIVGPQTGGLTAQERADMLTRRLQVAANRLPAASATDISVAPVLSSNGSSAVSGPSPVDVKSKRAAEITTQEQIFVGTVPIIVIDQKQAKAAGFPSAERLATAWAKNVRTAMGLTALAPSVSPPATPAPAAGGA